MTEEDIVLSMGRIYDADANEALDELGDALEYGGYDFEEDFELAD